MLKKQNNISLKETQAWFAEIVRYLESSLEDNWKVEKPFLDKYYSSIFIDNDSINATLAIEVSKLDGTIIWTAIRRSGHTEILEGDQVLDADWLPTTIREWIIFNIHHFNHGA